MPFPLLFCSQLRACSLIGERESSACLGFGLQRAAQEERLEGLMASIQQKYGRATLIYAVFLQEKNVAMPDATNETSGVRNGVRPR